MRFRKIIKINLKYFFIITPILLLFSCNVTKDIGKNEKLLAKNKIEINKKSKGNNDLGFESFDIEQIIHPKPNSTFFWLPAKLWIYQLYSPELIKIKETELNNNCDKKNKKQVAKLIKKLKRLEQKRTKQKQNSKKYNNISQRISKTMQKKERIENNNCNKKHWSRKIGEAPVFFSVNDEYKNPQKIRVFLKNKGYFYSTVKIKKKPYRNYLQEIFLPSPNFIINSKINKLNFYPGKILFNSLYNLSEESKNKIIVKYIIETGEATKIKNIKYNIKNNKLNHIIVNNKKTLLKQNGRLDYKIIEEERKRISEQLRNAGYYTFSKDYIYFTIDTIGKNNFADITVNILTNTNNNDVILKKHIVKNVYIYPNFKSNEALINKDAYFNNQDTLIYYTKKGKKYNLIYKDVQRINKKAVVGGIGVASGDFYNLKEIKKSYKYLASLPIIQTANITFRPTTKDSLDTDSFDYIDCEIRLSQDKSQQYEIAGELTNTSRNFGVVSSLNYTHNNFFRRMEVLNLKFNIEFRRLTRNPDYEFDVSDKLFNSQKYGTEFDINFPRLFVPYFIKKYFVSYNAKSNISGNFNYTKRPDYTWAIAGAAYGYNWISTNTIKHYLLPLTADYFYKIENYLPDIINNRNYDDRFILGGSYKFVFNNQYTRKQKRYFLITAYTKIAGNSLYGVKKYILKEDISANGSYSVFGNTFAQFVKTYFDIRYYNKVNSYNDNIAMRMFIGAAIPYGNLNVIPFNEQFYSGGSTGIRAWDERSLGPGSYVENTPDQFFYQKSDIKLEGNIEFRKNIVKNLESAIFIDAGNIWAINKEDEKEGALFKFKDFYKEIAIGTGFGIRYNLGFIIIRTDIGMKVKDPTLPENNRWLSANEFFSLGNMKLNIGIGYPF